MPKDTNNSVMTNETQPTATPAADLEHERLSSLINSMGDGVLAIDENHVIVMSNGAALNVLDVNTSLTGQNINQVLNLVDKNNQPVNVRQLIDDTKTPFNSRDYKIIYSDSDRINLYLSIAPVRLGYGQAGTKGHVLLLRDITREKSLEEERDEFISVVSHELRTPIAIAEGNISNAELLYNKSPQPDQVIVDSLRQAHDQINFLASLINDLSTLSRAERGKLQVELEAVNPAELLKDLVKSYEREAAAKSLAIHQELDPGLEVFHTSRLYLREIMQNFITNAIKYTEKGSITVGARPTANGTEFYVSDTGIGISKADQEKVFDKFFRSEDFRTRQNNGTGLGLYVTIKLARLIHAEIDLHSELNKGSTFTITVPSLE